MVLTIEKASDDFCTLIQTGGRALRVNDLVDTQLSVLMNLVSFGGFKPLRLEKGLMRERYTDADEYYCVNETLQYKVVETDGTVSKPATLWLEWIFREALNVLAQDKEHFPVIIKKKILEGIPLIPIKLTEENDLLKEFPANGPFSGHSKDEDDIGRAGVHAYCGGFVDIKRTSETHRALHCRSCGLRVAFPVTIKTYGDLRNALASI